MYCLDTAPAEHLHLTLPHALRGLVPVDLLTSSKSQSSLQNADRQYHYMKAIAAPQLSSHLQITIPAYGAVLASPEEIRLNFAGEPFDQVVCKLKDLDDVILSNGTRAIRAAQIEVGSWFFEIVPVRRNPLRGGFPSYGYMEYVLSPYDIASQRLFYAHQSHTAEQAAWYSALSTQFHHHRLDERQSNRTGGNDQIDVCIWSYNKIDGQSRIWLTQTELMRDRFRFSWVLNAKGRSIAALQAQSRESLAGTVLDALFAFPDVQVADNPFQYVLFNQTALSEVPVDGGPLAADSMVGDSQDRQDAINRYIRGRFLSADKQIDQVSPLWCREIYQQVRQVLLDLQCDIVVYGNNRGRSTDYLITDTARTLGIPSVTELVNLFMHEDVVPDVIVAPSHFALLHESVQKMLKASEMNDHRPPVSVVISPAVDLKHFQPPLLRNSQKSCQVMNDASQRACVTVGFLGRVTSSKNPGLFMQAAYHILQSFAFARFVIIGDGSLRKDLEELAERLQIVDKVEFRGFVSYKNLPDHLADIDVLINTSLGGFWETFCISNIEAMAMEIPMVTFAIGGMYALVVPHTARFASNHCSQVLVNTSKGQCHRMSLNRGVLWTTRSL